MANRWGNSGNSERLYFGGSKIITEGDCSHEIKRRLLLGRKVMTNLDSILQSRDITLPTKACQVNTMVSPVVMYGCESWTIKKAECRRTDAFELWCWRRLESPLDCKEIQPVHPKGNKPWVFIGMADIGWNSNILATWCEELTHLKRPWCWETLKTGGERDDRGWDGWMASLTQWTWVWVNSGSWWWTGRPGVLQSRGSQRVRQDWATELNWIRFVIAFLPRSKHLLISWLHLPSAVILEPKKRKSVTASTFSPSIYHEVMAPDATILVFLNIEF